MKIFLDSEELNDNISKNIIDIHLKFNSTDRVIILKILKEYTKSPLNICSSAYLMINELKGRVSKAIPSKLFENEM